MKITIAITSLLIFASSAYSQSTSDDCVKTKSLTKKDLSKTFPFDRSKKIQLVSFDPGDTESIPLKNGRIDTLTFKETKKLIAGEEEKLIDILLNYAPAPKNSDGPQEVIMCYNPRNAVLFKDDRNNIIAYIEICFECLKYHPSGIYIAGFCQNKYDMLKAFFQQNNVKFGTTEK